jgi:hypothetical protein
MRYSLVLPSLAVLSLLLSACAASPGAVTTTRPVKSTATRVRPAIPQRTPPVARVQSLPGLEGVIGATASDLTRQFGDPRLDVIEGDVRKLQFSGQPCVLDVYLYPSPSAREPRATYVDARRASDGRDVDRAACVASLRRR